MVYVPIYNFFKRRWDTGQWRISRTRSTSHCEFWGGSRGPRCHLNTSRQAEQILRDSLTTTTY